MQKWSFQVRPSLKRVSTVSCTSSRCFKISKWIVFTYTLGTFQTAAFVLGTEMIENTWKSFKKRISFSYSPLGPLDINPVNFLSQTFWRLISPVQVLRVRVPGIWQKLPVFFSGETLNYHIPFPLLWVTMLGVMFWWDYISTSPICLTVALLPFDMEKQFTYFSVLFHRELFCVYICCIHERIRIQGAAILDWASIQSFLGTNFPHILFVLDLWLLLVSSFPFSGLNLCAQLYNLYILYVHLF